MGGNTQKISPSLAASTTSARQPQPWHYTPATSPPAAGRCAHRRKKGPDLRSHCVNRAMRTETHSLHKMPISRTWPDVAVRERVAPRRDSGSRFASVTRSRASAWTRAQSQRPTPNSQPLPTPTPKLKPLGVGVGRVGVRGLALATAVDAFVGIAKRNRWPSGLTFFHCSGFPGSGPGRLNSIRGVPALNVGVVSTSTAMTSQLRVMK